MSWNDGIERKKFEANWEKEEAEFRVAGMTEDQIHSMRELEEEQYNSDRRYYSHTQPFEPLDFDPDEDDDEKLSIFEKFKNELTVSIEEDEICQSRYGWIDEIHNEDLQMKLISLSDEDKEILTLLAFESKKQKEIAEIMDIPYRTIKYRIRRIRNFLKK